MEHMETFLSLPDEKQNAVIDAGLQAFGQNGYKKASVGDIACAAGVSKAMIFYYFGCKKGLYRYLVKVCGETFVGEIEKNLDVKISDYFDRLRMMTELKIAALKKHPSLFLFLKSIYYEKDEEAKDVYSEIRVLSERYRDSMLLSASDLRKFKDGVDAELIIKFLVWAAEGFSSGLTSVQYDEQVDAYIQDFYKCLDMMKSNFYKKGV